jgi:hypothetical protein
MTVAQTVLFERAFGNSTTINLGIREMGCMRERLFPRDICHAIIIIARTSP